MREKINKKPSEILSAAKQYTIKRKRGIYMKFKKMSTRMLAFILPVILVAMLVLTIISAQSSRGIIQTQIANYMAAELNAQGSSIKEKIDRVSASAMDISKMVQTTYTTVNEDSYISMLGEIVKSNDLVLGSGLWFEPYAYKADEKYVGPYVYKENNKVQTTYEYSNASYDYFSQDYYKTAKNTKEPAFTEPYYDTTSGIVMSSCTAPIYDGAGKFVGCVTVDIQLTDISDMINQIKVGDGGSAMLVSASGTYLGCQDVSKVTDGINITEDSNASLAQAAKTILANDNGQTSYQNNGVTYNLYYGTLKGLGWKTIIQIPVTELNQPVNALLVKLIVVCMIALVCSVLAVILQITSVTRKIKKVQIFANALSEGDFTVERIKLDTADELGKMGGSLNNMYESNKGVIANISGKAEEISSSSEKLSSAAKQLMTQFESIETYMNQVNEDMMSASAATEEVNASTEEVNASVSMLAEETNASRNMANEIKGRASEIGKVSKNSYDNATQLSTRYEDSLTVSIENAKVVENIGRLAGIISEIAEQINLLSLNASIEAARAGEQGKGFAVVASEIGKLANETAQAVQEIQQTVSAVQSAFSGLTDESKAMVEFLKNTVTPDYNSFVEVAEQYGKDADSIEHTSNNISEMASNIRHIMQEVSEAIQNIAETSQNTAYNSSRILKSVTDVSEVVDDVSGMSRQQEEIAGTLNTVVGQFKLEK